MGVPIPRPNVLGLIDDLEALVTKIPVDIGGGSPLSKTVLMAQIALEHQLKTYVEIGVYRGRSFFAMAHAMQLTGGIAYGIDPYDRELARELDLEEELKEEVDEFVSSLDFDLVYQDACAFRYDNGFSEHSELIRKPSSEAVGLLRQRAIAIDILHIDGNHDTKHVLEDVALYLPLVKDGGFIVMDDIDWGSVKPGLAKLQETCDLVFLGEHFAILTKGNAAPSISDLERRRYGILNGMVHNFEDADASYREPASPDRAGRADVSVIVLAYDQAQFIPECLEGVLAQTGDIAVELVIGDDGSTDGTSEIILDYLRRIQANHHFRVVRLPSDRNLGMTPNLKRCLDACSGDYIAICEGDDYWLDCLKLQKQVDFLKEHPRCALCFNDMYILDEETRGLGTFQLQQECQAEVLTTKDIILDYTIGNMSTCMYDARFMKEVPPSLFGLYIGDWFFNTYYSTFGGIGHVKETMSVYRKHIRGEWAGKTLGRAAADLHPLIDEYNRYLNFEFDVEYSAAKRRLEKNHPEEFHQAPLDLAIIDDVFPHPLSPFRFLEFTDYMDELGSVRVYCSGESLRALGSERLDDLVRDFKRRYPHHARRVEILWPDTTINAHLIYMIFLGNAYVNIQKIEELRTPFVFTLYPGGSFGLNNARTDMMLRRVTSSPCFRKVIVTQRVTYDYLIENGFCRPELVEFIFGIVTTAGREGRESGLSKKQFGRDKDTLDICFVAYKYTAKGLDKGYDIFVEAARRLCQEHGNIRFHVVGGFDETDIDLSGVQDKFAFYGRRESEWFDRFYEDKDIILSPTVPSRIFEGSFDGFPTGSCIEAGLRRTAIFCTDELELNTHFADGKDIVIIPHNGAEVARMIGRYYRDPEALARIAENGYQRIQEIYSYDGQMMPRIRILQDEIARAEASKAAAVRAMEQRAPVQTEAFEGSAKGGRQAFGPLIRLSIVRAGVSLKGRSPVWLLRLIQEVLDGVRGNRRVFLLVRGMLPMWLRRLYWEIRDSD